MIFKFTEKKFDRTIACSNRSLVADFLTILVPVRMPRRCCVSEPQTPISLRGPVGVSIEIETVADEYAAPFIGHIERKLDGAAEECVKHTTERGILRGSSVTDKTFSAMDKHALDETAGAVIANLYGIAAYPAAPVTKVAQAALRIAHLPKPTLAPKTI